MAHVLEVATIAVRHGSEQAFEAAFPTARRLLQRSEGFQTSRLVRGIEDPSRFLLLVEWDSVQSHDDFRASDRFSQWRGLLGPFFDGLPHVAHFRDIVPKGAERTSGPWRAEDNRSPAFGVPR